MEIGLNNYNYNNNNRTSDFGPPFDLWSLFITTAATNATTASTSATTTTTTTTRTIKSSHDVAAIKQAATSATIHRFIRSFSYFTDNGDPSSPETSSTTAQTILRDCFNFSLENGFGNPIGQTGIGHHHQHHHGGHRPLTTISTSSSSSASSSTITTTESFDYFYLNELLKEKFNDATVIISVIILVLINIIVIFGNILVILSVFVSTKLRTVTNFFIVSLAVADFLVGIAVLPYSLTFEILDTWIFGEVWCQGWLVIDVWMCTASILNLCAISVDRYMAVTRPVRYRSLMTAKRAKFIIAGVWIISFIICFPPLLVGKQEPFSRSSLTTTTTMATTTTATIRDSMAPITTTATTTTAEDVLAYQQFRRKSSTSPLSSNNDDDDGGGGGGGEDDDDNEEDEDVDGDGRFIYHDDHDPQVSSIIPGRIVASSSSSSFDDNNRKAMKTTDDDVDVVVDLDDHHDEDDHNNNNTNNDDGDYDPEPNPDLNPNYDKMNQSSLSNDATVDDAGSSPTSSTYYKQCKPQPVQCALFRNKSYVIYSAFGSFFIPMFVMIFFYWRIYLVAIRTSRALKRGYRITKTTTNNNDDNNQQERLTLRIHRGYATEENTGGAAVIQEKRPSIDNDNVHQQKHYRSSWATTFHRSSNQTETAIVDHQPQPPTTTTTMGGGSDKLLQIPGKISTGTGTGTAGPTGHTGHVERNCRRNSSGYQSNMSLPFSASSSREGSARGSKTNLPVRPSKRASKYQAKRFHAETKAAKTVGIIVGGFIVCWLPFFTVYLTRAFCEDCIPELLFSIFFWLGYCNSMINPCIYGLFSKDFRRAFKNIICRCRLREETSVSSLIRQIHMPTFFEDMPEEMARQESQDY